MDFRKINTYNHFYINEFNEVNMLTDVVSFY